MKRFRVSPVSVLTYPLFAYFCGTYVFCLFLATIALHEAGHLIAICFSRVRVVRITVLPSGLEIRRGEGCSYLREIVISLAGPLVGFVVALAAWHLGYNEFCMINLACSLFNLIPASTLDGGCALRSALLYYLPFERADLISRTVGAVSLFILYIFSVLLLLYTEWNATLLVLCLVLFLGVFFTEKE